ncbi:potassium channel family protein [Paraburkholderia unamae]|nr:potassium channel family protein [Paraburkholderia unamae]
MNDMTWRKGRGYIHARDAITAYFRILWYLRSILAGLLVAFFALSMAMYYLGGAVQTGTRAPSSPGEVLYFCAVTALTIGYGDIVATTATGRIIAVSLGLLGVLITGVTTAVGVYAIQEAAQRIGLPSHENRATASNE